MRWNDLHTDLLQRFANRFGLPDLDGASARAWTLKLAEQFAFDFPSERWGTKRADPGRPLSTDVICTHSPFLGYDVLLNQGVPGQKLDPRPHALDLTGQVFIAVTPFDHLQETVPLPRPVVPPDATPPQACAVDLAPVLALLADQQARIEALTSMVAAAHLAAMEARHAAMSITVGKAPDYTGKIWGQSFTLKPVR